MLSRNLQEVQLRRRSSRRGTLRFFPNAYEAWTNIVVRAIPRYEAS